MANSLNINLRGKIVLIKKRLMNYDNQEEMKRAFLVSGGFGAEIETNGSSLFGTFLCDGERTKMDGYQIERLAPQYIVDYYKNLKQTLANLNDE